MLVIILSLLVTFINCLNITSHGGSNEIQDLTARLASLEREVQTLKQDKQNPPVVAFTAILSHNTQLRSNQVIIYDIVKSNIGNGYNPSTGIFTAPHDGTYFFFMTAFSKPNEFAHLQLVKNGVELVRAHSASPGYDTGVNAVVTQLKAGESTWVRHHDGYGDEPLYSDYYNTFTGYLIQ